MTVHNATRESKRETACTPGVTLSAKRALEQDLSARGHAIEHAASVLLVPFAAYTAYTMTIAEQSPVSFGYELLSRPDTAQVVIDLYIMVILATVWMYRDSEDIDRRWLWAVCSAPTLVFVSIGPLLYLLLRPSDAGPMICETGSST